jgi:hypothetical protein
LVAKADYQRVPTGKSMHVLAIPQEERGPPERRVAERRPAAMRGVLRHFKRGAEFIDLVDIPTHGRGSTSRWPFEAGTRVFLGLGGVEPRPAAVAWHEDRQGGLQFDRALPAALAERLAGVEASIRPGLLRPKS